MAGIFGTANPGNLVVLKYVYATNSWVATNLTTLPGVPSGRGYNVVSGWGGSYPAGTWNAYMFSNQAANTQSQPPPPMATSPNLDVSFDAWGTAIPLIMGNCRIMGKILWAQGLEVGTSVPIPETLDLAVGFAYPLDPDEWQWIQVVGLWANGIKFFGGDNDIASIVWTFYKGTENQDPDPLIVADKGADRCTGFRGLRYIVFPNFPLGLTGNTLPSISAEFSLPPKIAPAPDIGVADCLQKVGAKSGITLGATATFDDRAAGAVFMADIVPVDLFSELARTYNYFILDGDGASLSRRAVNDDIVIDAVLVMDDLVVESPTETAISFARLEQSQVPEIAQIQYTDIDLAYTNGNQIAQRPDFPIRQTLSDMRVSIVLPFGLDATTALLLAFDQLYRMITEQLTITFKTSNILIEVGDVLEVDGGDLGAFIVRVTNSNLRFDTAALNEITATALLKRTGTDAVATSGDYLENTRIPARNYPQIIYIAAGLASQFGQIATSNGRLITFGLGRIVDFSQQYGYQIADVSIPANVAFADFALSSSDDPSSPQGRGQIIQDSFYYYVWDYGQAGVQRVNKLNAQDTLYLDLTASVPEGLASNGNQFESSNGFIYFCGATSGSDPIKLYRLDTSLFSADGLTSLTLPSTNGFNQLGAVIIGTDMLLTLVAAASARVYKIALDTFTITTSATTSGVPAANQGYLGRGTTDGTYAYFLPAENGDGQGTNPQIYGAKIDPTALTSSGGITYWNITDDASVTFGSLGNVFPWNDGTNIYFLANDDHSGSPYTQFLASRKLSDMSVQTGFDLTTLYDDTHVDFFHGTTDGDFHYITGGDTVFVSSLTTGAMLKINQDMSGGELFFNTAPSPPPANDDFINASPLATGATVSTNNTGATKEVGEPDANGATGGHSIWYNYTAPSGGTVSIDATATTAVFLQIGVYTGEAVNALSDVTSGDGFGVVTFTATAGQRYRIQLDGFDASDFGAILFTFTGP